MVFLLWFMNVTEREREDWRDTPGHKDKVRGISKET